MVENGSAADQKLGEEFVEGFGPEFRYVDLGEEAQPSPSHALNRGIKEGRGANFALMIDGAHVLTPGVLHFGLDGLQTYEPAIVATQQWYVGPGQQGDAMRDGYDQEYEDRLFERIDWPEDGYRLFEIGHFVGGRDWLDGVWESNCMFVPRALLEQVGGFDESFSMAGGGFANLDLYERLGSSPDVTVVSDHRRGIVPPGARRRHHQPARRRRARHSGSSATASTSPTCGAGASAARASRSTTSGRIGSPEARRDRARGASPSTLRRGGADARARRRSRQPPVPMPEDLRSSFIEAVWRSLAWKRDHLARAGTSRARRPTSSRTRS